MRYFHKQILMALRIRSVLFLLVLFTSASLADIQVPMSKLNNGPKQKTKISNKTDDELIDSFDTIVDTVFEPINVEVDIQFSEYFKSTSMLSLGLGSTYVFFKSEKQINGFIRGHANIFSIINNMFEEFSDAERGAHLSPLYVVGGGARYRYPITTSVFLDSDIGIYYTETMRVMASNKNGIIPMASLGLGIKKESGIENTLRIYFIPYNQHMFGSYKTDHLFGVISVTF